MSQQDSSRCNYVQAVLDSMTHQFKAEDQIIAISFLGQREKAKIARLRLNSIVAYWKSRVAAKYVNDQTALTPAVATVKRVDGTIEFYVNGKLQLTLVYWRNRVVRYKSCYDDKYE